MLELLPEWNSFTLSTRKKGEEEEKIFIKNIFVPLAKISVL